MTLPEIPHAVFGVDFSGAQDAGRKIWIAGGRIDGDRLRIDWCAQAADLHGSGVAREVAYPAVYRLVAGSGISAFGFDFPFSLSQRAIRHATWEAFALTFARAYPTPEAFRAQMQALGSDAATIAQADTPGLRIGHETILKRRTDIDAKTPFAPHNERLYRQTYYGIRDLLSLLVRYNRARILPMQDPVVGVPWVIEICPASTLKSRALYIPYKRGEMAARDHRGRVLAALEKAGVVIDRQQVRAKVLADDRGDALDSVLGAYAVWRALQNPWSLAPHDDQERIEGRVYY